MQKSDLYWLAGLLEGEGYFTIVSNSGSPSAQVSMTDRDVVERAAHLMGSNINIRHYSSKNPKWKDQYRAYLCGNKAIEFMEMIHPLMGDRRKVQIDRVLKRAAQRPGGTRGEAVHCSKLNEVAVRVVRWLYVDGVSQRKLSRVYGVCPQTINVLVHGKTWKHVQ